MARSYYHNDSKLNQYIQPRIKKYYNYTHQKLIEEEISIKKKIDEMSIRINGTEKNLRETNQILNKFHGLQSEVRLKISDEEQHSKNKIIDKGELNYPTEPFHPIFNIRNFVCLVISIVGVVALLEKFGDGAIIFFLSFFIPLRIIAGWVLKDEDMRTRAEYHNKVREYENKIKSQFKPSEKYKKNLKTEKKLELDIKKTNLFLRECHSDLKKFKFEIILLKKILFEFKRFKKRASERERTAKINAFEQKNRSGAQNIKDKLIKAVRVKSKWTCVYCNNISEISLAEADHIHPVNKGGMTTMQNMVLICKKCNSKKTNLMLRVFCKKQGFNYDEVCERLERLGKDV
mgnify:CR=1 FL=1